MENDHRIAVIQKIPLHMACDALLCPCEESLSICRELGRCESVIVLEKQSYPQDGGEKFY